MILRIEVEREVDGRWLAEVADLPGVLAYGPSVDAAVLRACDLARLVVAERSPGPDTSSLRFVVWPPSDEDAGTAV